jgi:hypothetical protein
VVKRHKRSRQGSTTLFSVPMRGWLWALAGLTILLIVWRQGWRTLLLGQLFAWSPWAAGAEFALLLLANVALAALLLPVILRIRTESDGQTRAEWRCTGEELPARDLGWPGLSAVLQAVILEETLARAFFAMALPALFGGAFIFWALGGNFLWSLLHLTNPGAGRPHPLKVLPHFIGGLVYLVAFLLFGLAAAIAAHLTYDITAHALPAFSRWRVHRATLQTRRPALSSRRSAGH